MEQNTRNKIENLNKVITADPYQNKMESPATQQLQLLSIQDVCKCLNIGHWMVYKLIGEKKLRSVTIGRRRLIPVQAVQDFLAQSERSFDG